MSMFTLPQMEIVRGNAIQLIYEAMNLKITKLK